MKKHYMYHVRYTGTGKGIENEFEYTKNVDIITQTEFAENLFDAIKTSVQDYHHRHYGVEIYDLKILLLAKLN